ncbi:MAG: PAS domain S-box protein [Nitrospira sp.]|nr:PAS domain S-box protein [Nitrospira sp.]MBH0183746.1 PAS domain S-box protein [Nitrospira sp.]MBH0187010.1 PAS domain S-box protein [Nitrospira sp.]
MNLLDKEWRLHGVMLLLLTLLFVVDIETHHGFANHVLYVIVVLTATLSRHVWMPAAVAGIGTVLTVIGMIVRPGTPGLPLWMPLWNRAFTITMLWIMVWFAWKRREAESALKVLNENLEETVTERTRELTSVNRALVLEITERMQAEQAFRLSEGRLAGILNIAEDAVIITERDQSISLFNQGAAKLFGYEPNEVLGHSIDLLIPGRFRHDHTSHMDTFARSPESARRMALRREVFGLRKDGSEFPAEASISKLTVGERTTFTVIVRDISDRLMTEHQLQSLTTQLMTAQEEERRRIAQELHDDINQRLALLAIDMGRVESNPAVTTDQAREVTRSLALRLAVISDDVRRMAYQFHPSILDDLGLTAALKQLADEWSVKTGIKVVVVQEELVDPLPRNIASCLYRVTQESLANIIKHAKTARVEIELTCGGQEITLSIYDSGVGFDLKEIQARHPGLGLVNMRERARSVGGHFDIQSEPGRGTHITVQIPLSGAPHEETKSSLGR